MPTVRTYARQITTQAAPTVRRPEQQIAQLTTPPPVVPSTGALEGMARFGQSVASIGEQLYAAEQHKQDQMRLLEADRQAGQVEYNLMYHPETGALHVRGRDSLALPDSVGKTWDTETGKIRQGLANDRQRIAFDQHTVTKRQAMMDRLSDHIATESYQADARTLEGKVENDTQAALADPLPEKVNQRLMNIDQAYDDWGALYHVPPEYTKAAKAKARSRVLAGVIDRQLKDGNYMEAQVTYDHVEKDILGQDRGDIEKGLRVGNLRRASQEIADSIMNANRQGETGDEPPTLRELHDQVAVRTQGNPELRDATEARVDAVFAKDQEDDRIAKEKRNEIIQQSIAAAKARDDQAKAQHAQLVDKTILNLIDKNRPKDVHMMLDAIDPAIWADMTGKERTDTETYAKRQEKGEDVPENDAEFAAYYELSALSSSPDTRNEFAKKDLRSPQYLAAISKRHLNQLTQVQDAIRKDLGGKKASQLTEGFRTVNEMAQDSLGLMLGHKPDPKNKDEYRQLTTLHSLVDQDIADWEHQTGKKPTKAEIQGFIDQHLIRGTTTEKGLFWDSQTQKMSIDVPDDQSFDIQFSQIPKNDVRQIKEALARAGKPESEAIIKQMYLAKIRKNAPPKSR